MCEKARRSEPRAEIVSGKSFFANQRKIDTPSGSISYAEQGTGPVAFFVHGVLLNGYLWRHQLEQLHGLRRCIAMDLLAHGLPL
jgi:pimeloyl-ACP methyl ester carboxylesterase